MSTVEILVWFVLVPATLYVVISLLVYTPSWVRGPKYRPGLDWWAQPVWIGGADLDSVDPGRTAREEGGCSARW